MTADTNAMRAVASAGLAELVWTASDGGPPQALGVVPLVLGEQPAIALSWAHVQEARAAAAGRSAVLVLSDPRLSGAAWSPLALHGRLTLVEDADGSLFSARLLDQELRKHPPARGLADSVLLRREHWWYLPRLLLLLDPVEVVPVRARQDPQDAVLAVDDGRLSATTVRVADWEAPVLELAGAPDGPAGPAALVGQEVSVPDVERWTVHRTTGHYAAGHLDQVHPAQTRSLEPVPGLLARVRRQRALERACLRALRAAGHG